MSLGQLIFGIRITANGGDAAREIDRIRNGLDGASGAAEANARAMTSAAGAIGRYVAAAAGIMSAGRMIELADQWGQIASRIELAAGGADAAAAAAARLMEVSNRTYKSFENSAELYIRTGKALEELGYSADSALGMVEALQYGLTVSAASGERAASVIDAWSKSINNGKMGLEEFQAVLNGAPRLVQALAESLGKSTVELQQMARGGQITADVLMRVGSQAGALGAEADKMPVTLADAFQRAENSLMKFAGSAEANTGVIKMMTSGITALSDNIDLVAAAAGTVAVAAFGRYAGGLYASATATIASARAAQQAAVAEAQLQLAQARAAVAAAHATRNSTALAAARAREAAATQALAIAQRGVAASSVLARGALAALGGPLGIIITALGAAAIAASAYSSRMDEAAAKTRNAVDEMERNRKRLAGWSEQDLADEAALKSRRDKVYEARGALEAAQKAAGTSISWAVREEAKRSIPELEKALKDAEEALDIQQKLIDKEGGMLASANASYETYINERRSLSDIRDADLESERQAFARATAGMGKDSAEYVRALEAHNRAIAKINEEYAKKNSGGAAKKEAADLKKITEESSKHFKGLLDGEVRKINEARQAADARAQSMRAVVESQRAAADALAGQNERLREEIETIGMSAEQIARYRAAKLEAAAADASALAEKYDELATYYTETEILPELAEQYRRLAQEKRRAAEAGMQQADLTVELAAARASSEAAENARKQWEQTSQAIEQSIYDAIIGGGVDAGEALRRTFKSLVLRPIIQPIAQYGANLVTGFVNQLTGGMFGSGNSGSNLMDAASNLNSLGSIYGGISQWLTGASAGASSLSLGYANLVGAFGGDSIGALYAANGGWSGVNVGASGGSSAGTLGPYAAGIGGALWGYNATNGSYVGGVVGGAAGMAGYGAVGGYMSGAGAASGAASSLGSIPGWGWIAAAVVAVIADAIAAGNINSSKFSWQMANDPASVAWEDEHKYGYEAVSATGAFGTIGLATSSKHVDAEDLKQWFDALATFDNLVAAGLTDDEIASVKSRLDGWTSERTDNEYLGPADRIQEMIKGIGGYVADTYVRLLNPWTGANMNFMDWARLPAAERPGDDIDWLREKVPTGQGAQERLLLSLIRVDDIQEGLGKMNQSISGDRALGWLLDSAGKMQVTGDDGKMQTIDVDGWTVLSTALGTVYDLFYNSPIDNVRAQWKALNEQFAEAGDHTMPASAAEYKNILESIDLNTEAGQELYVTLAGLAPAVASFQAGLLNLIGTTRNDLVSIVARGLSGANTREQTAAALNEAITEGIWMAMADNTAQQVADLMIGGIINPAISALVLGNDIAEALAVGHVEEVVRKISAQVDAFNAVMNAPAIKDLFDTVKNAISGISSVLGGAANGGYWSDGGAGALDTSAYEALRDAANGQADMYRQQAREAEALALEFERLRDSLASYRRELTLGDLAKLSPEARYLKTQAEFEDIARRAQLGDQGAIEALETVSRDFLDASDAYYAASAHYFSDRDRVLAVVNNTIGLTSRQVDAASINARAALAAADAALAAAKAIQDAIDAIRQQPSANDTFTQVGWSTGGLSLWIDASGAIQVRRPDGSVDPDYDKNYNILDGQPWFSGATFAPYGGFDLETWARLHGMIPGYAEGGHHAGGLRLVGERGPELEVTGPARYYDTESTLRLLAGNGGGDPQTRQILREVLMRLDALVRQGGEVGMTLSRQLAALGAQLDEVAIETRRRQA
ncbi:MAG: tape measure protein [Candidatus Accumulibacter sp.]|jgi:tape measure domain-containing protein|nr:tape measure protein [Accumulibacter sp.]